MKRIVINGYRGAGFVLRYLRGTSKEARAVYGDMTASC